MTKKTSPIRPSVRPSLSPAQRSHLIEWVKALRSGEYLQTTGTLKGFDLEGQPVYCCLGVACELYGKVHSIGWEYDEHSVFRFLGEGECLPDPVIQYLGMLDRNGSVPSRFNPPNNSNGFGSLIAANDSGLTFAQIADLIEKEFLNG